MSPRADREGLRLQEKCVVDTTGRGTVLALGNCCSRCVLGVQQPPGEHAAGLRQTSPFAPQTRLAALHWSGCGYEQFSICQFTPSACPDGRYIAVLLSSRTASVLCNTWMVETQLNHSLWQLTTAMPTHHKQFSRVKRKSFHNDTGVRNHMDYIANV
ncbi:hypothetical protein SS50377_24113 [Spironucleus salmonicida]|nr:hypothetical protein SS50377_24111 [Spironucleus salmonicida]KAH0574166.1 hypothetical protein SS50377_24113 [Spironucleus salmonicida]|eukprot:EST44107.1 Hypothetical protein SS50377_16106 [Spironucleus salmonicida]